MDKVNTGNLPIRNGTGYPIYWKFKISNLPFRPDVFTPDSSLVKDGGGISELISWELCGIKSFYTEPVFYFSQPSLQKKIAALNSSITALGLLPKVRKKIMH